MSDVDKTNLEDLLKLKQTPELLQVFADAFPFLISYVDKNRTYQFHNKEYERRFNCTYDDIHGKHIADLLGTEAYECIKLYIDKALAGERVRYESLIPYKDGERFMDVQYIPDIDSTNKVLGFIAIVHYISDKKNTEAPQGKFDVRMSEIMSAVIELSCAAEEVRIKLEEATSPLRHAEEKNARVNDLIKKWTVDLKASEGMVSKVKTAIEAWLEKNGAA